MGLDNGAWLCFLFYIYLFFFVWFLIFYFWFLILYMGYFEGTGYMYLIYFISI